jgi:predicted RNase H-like HicB family nuclease
MTTPKQASKRSRPQRPDHRYELIVYWSDPDDAFVVEMPELPGCMADGPTSAAAAAAAEVVILEWIETARELGRPIPEPRGRLLFA